MKVNLAARTGLNSNGERKAIVKSVSFFKPEYTTIGHQEIHLETEDGLSTPSGGWFINRHCLVHVGQFCAAREKIISGIIKAGSEITIVYNPNGIMYFY